jgi:8-oxo-dGTP pyrophosphatase MutT (NUDIX family)
METEVYKGQIIQVTEEKINGIVWERAYVPSGVIIFPITDEGKILMIKEKRPHENPPVRLKPVSGILETKYGGPEENAQREMQEEIGFKANKMEEFMTLKGSGTLNSTQHYFKATGLIPSKLPNPDGEDIILEIIGFTPDELLGKFMRDEIKWSHSTLGFFRLFHELKKS